MPPVQLLVTNVTRTVHALTLVFHGGKMGSLNGMDDKNTMARAEKSILILGVVDCVLV